MALSPYWFEQSHGESLSLFLISLPPSDTTAANLNQTHTLSRSVIVPFAVHDCFHTDWWFSDHVYHFRPRTRDLCSPNLMCACLPLSYSVLAEDCSDSRRREHLSLGRTAGQIRLTTNKSSLQCNGQTVILKQNCPAYKCEHLRLLLSELMVGKASPLELSGVCGWWQKCGLWESHSAYLLSYLQWDVCSYWCLWERMLWKPQRPSWEHPALKILWPPLHSTDRWQKWQ